MMNPPVSLLFLACLACSFLIPLQKATKQTGGHQTDQVHLGYGPGEALKVGLLSLFLSLSLGW